MFITANDIIETAVIIGGLLAAEFIGFGGVLFLRGQLKITNGKPPEKPADSETAPLAVAGRAA